MQGIKKYLIWFLIPFILSFVVIALIAIFFKTPTTAPYQYSAY